MSLSQIKKDLGGARTQLSRKNGRQQVSEKPKEGLIIALILTVFSAKKKHSLESKAGQPKSIQPY